MGLFFADPPSAETVTVPLRGTSCCGRDPDRVFDRRAHTANVNTVRQAAYPQSYPQFGRARDFAGLIGSGSERRNRKRHLFLICANVRSNPEATQ